MTIANRMNRLFQADVHGILDQLEDPVTSAKQAVREMEECIHEDEKQLAQQQKREKHLHGLLLESRRVLAELAGQIQLALRDGSEELVRSLVRKQLEEEARVREIEAALEKVRGALEEIGARLASRREQLAEIVKKLEVFVEPSSLCEDTGIGRRRRVVTDEDVEVAMLKLRKKEGV